MKSGPLTILNCTTHAYGYYQKLCKIRFSITDPTLTGQKCKHLIKKLEAKLKNFHFAWGGVSCHLADLDEFFVSRVSDTQIDGVWHIARFECSDTGKTEDARRENFEKIGSLIKREIDTWIFSHYKTSLRIIRIDE